MTKKGKTYLGADRFLGQTDGRGVNSFRKKLGKQTKKQRVWGGVANQGKKKKIKNL